MWAVVYFGFISWIVAKVIFTSPVVTGHQKSDSGILRLKKLKSTEPITLSGYSSGASFAHILHIAHSRLFSGVGIFAGLHYEYNGAPAFPKPWLQDPPGVGVNNSLIAFHKYRKLGLVDQPQHLAGQKVFIWAGTEDEFHDIDQRLGMVNIYEPFLKSPFQIYTKVQFADHDFPVGHCEKEAKSYKAQCHFDGKREMFRFFFDREPKIYKNGPFNQLQEFDQSEFFAGMSGEIAMNDVGLLYIPKTCLAHECHIHIYFHECTEQVWSLEDHKKDIIQTDFFGIAEGSRIIFVFPIARLTPISPLGCWDFLGWTGSKYATNHGNQVQVMRRIIRRITGN